MHKLLFIFSFIIASQAQSSVLELNFYGKTVKVFAESSKSPVFKKDAGHKDLHAFQIALRSNQWSSILEDLGIAADAMDLDDYGRFNLVKGFVLKHATGSIYTKKALVYVGLRMQGLDAMMAANASFLEIYISMKQVTDYGYSFNKFGKLIIVPIRPGIILEVFAY